MSNIPEEAIFIFAAVRTILSQNRYWFDMYRDISVNVKFPRNKGVMGKRFGNGVSLRNKREELEHITIIF